MWEGPTSKIPQKDQKEIASGQYNHNNNLIKVRPLYTLSHTEQHKLMSDFSQIDHNNYQNS